MILKTVRTRVIEMTREEATKFLALVEQAVKGQLVHSASTGMADGTQLAVTVLTPDQEKAAEIEEAERLNRRELERESARRYKARGHNHGHYDPETIDDR